MLGCLQDPQTEDVGLVFLSRVGLESHLEVMSIRGVLTALCWVHRMVTQNSCERLGVSMAP